MNRLSIALVLTLVAGAGRVAFSQEMSGHEHHHDPMTSATPQHGSAVDARQLVKFPDALRVQTLANMRDHLATLGQIQQALAGGAFDRASDLAEQRLGMSSLEMHGAHDVARYMPAGMQEAGTAMHHSASQFSLVAKDASATGDVKPALASLARLNQTCVACHAAYRLQ